MSEWFERYGRAEVGDGLMTGSYPCGREDVAALAADGVTGLVNLCEDGEYEDGWRASVEAALRERGLQEQRFEIVDYGRLMPDAIERSARQVVAWLDDGERVYVHCRAGWQRSAAVAAAALSVRDGIEPDEALGQIKRRKPSAEPLPHQREDLYRWWRLRAGS